MTAVVVMLCALALVASSLLPGVTPASSSDSAVPYFRATDSPKWQLDTSAAAPLNSASAATASTRASATEPVSFLWLFPLRNLDWLKAEVDETSNPASPRYLQRQPEEVVDAKVGPTSGEKDEVRQWLSSNGVNDSDIVDQRHVLKVRTTAGVVEQLFNTTMHHYRHTASGRTATVAASAVYVPAALAPRLSALSGVYNFPHAVYHVHAFRSSPRTGSSSSGSKQSGGSRRRANSTHSMHTMQTEETNRQCPSNDNIDFEPVLAPQTLATLYNFNERNTATTAQSTRAAVGGGFGGTDSNNQNYNEAFSQADLSHFQTNIGFSQSFSPQSYGNNNNANNLASNAANTGTGPTEEASLDIQAVRAAPLTHTAYCALCTEPIPTVADVPSTALSLCSVTVVSDQPYVDERLLRRHWRRPVCG